VFFVLVALFVGFRLANVIHLKLQRTNMFRLFFLGILLCLMV